VERPGSNEAVRGESAPSAAAAAQLLTTAMRRAIEQAAWGLVATVRPVGTPKLALVSNLAVWDDDGLVFPEIAAPDMIRDLLEHPAIAITVIDAASQQGFHFEGTARLLLSGPTFDRLSAFYTGRGLTQPAEHMVLVRLSRATPVHVPRILDALQMATPATNVAAATVRTAAPRRDPNPTRRRNAPA
jgi:predicted pyridoxine 5'-phosphate oxidase superfamily flavin-nucleotide-binding protein